VAIPELLPEDKTATDAAHEYLTDTQRANQESALEQHS